MNGTNDTNTNVVGYYYSDRDLPELIVTVVVPCCLLGIPGNILVVITLFRGNCGLSRSARLCYAVMAIADTVTLLCYASRLVPYLVPEAESWRGMHYTSVFTCRAMRWLTSTSIGLSTTVVTILCAERTYYVFNPLKARSRNGFRVTFGAVLASFTVQMILHGLLVAEYKVQTSADFRYEICMRNRTLRTLVTAFLLLFVMMISLAIQALVTCILVGKLTKVRRKRSAMLANRPSPKRLRREKLVAIVGAIISLMDLFLLLPQYVVMTFIAFNSIWPIFGSVHVVVSLRSFVNVLAQIDVVLWSSNILVLMRLPAFRKQLSHCGPSKLRN